MTIDIKIIPTAELIEAGLSADETCSGCGQPLKDHDLKCRLTRTGPKGSKGMCCFCRGPLHNARDKKQLQQFACLWRQIYNYNADKTLVHAGSVRELAEYLAMAERSYAPVAEEGKTLKTSTHPAHKRSATPIEGTLAPADITPPASEPREAPVSAATTCDASDTSAEPVSIEEAAARKKRRAKRALAKLAAGGGVR